MTELRNSQALLFVARLIKKLNPPHFIKFLYFHLFLRGRVVETWARMEISNLNISLDIGNFVEYWIFMDGLYEKKWVKQVKKYVEGKVFLDVGANIGNYTLALANTFKQSYAFEPTQQSIKKLEKNIEYNSLKNVAVVSKAVNSKNRQWVKLYTNQSDTGQNSLFIKSSPRYDLVATITLDSFVKSNNIKNIGLVKIDVEGAELEVLKGFEKTISKRHPPVLIELNKTIAEQSDHNLQDIFNFLISRGYEGFRSKESGLIKLTKTLDYIKNENILFLYRA